MKDPQTKFAAIRGFITTAGADGRVTINARTVARVEETDDALLNTLVTRANLAGDLADALIDLNAAVAAWRVTGTPDLKLIGAAQDRADEAIAKARDA